MQSLISGLGSSSTHNYSNPTSNLWTSTSYSYLIDRYRITNLAATFGPHFRERRNANDRYANKQAKLETQLALATKRKHRNSTEAGLSGLYIARVSKFNFNVTKFIWIMLLKHRALQISAPLCHSLKSPTERQREDRVLGWHTHGSHTWVAALVA